METTIARIDHRPTFAALLESAVAEPGSIARAYSAFHGFSLGNQLLAAMQCAERRLPLGPLASYQAGKQHGRHVRRGEQALWLWMPLTMRRPVTRDDAHGGDGDVHAVCAQAALVRVRTD